MGLVAAEVASGLSWLKALSPGQDTRSCFISDFSAWPGLFLLQESLSL